MTNNIDFIKNSSEKELIEKIDELSLVDILKNKKNLSLNFVVNYILNEKYCGMSEEFDIDISKVITYQPHLKYDEIKSRLN